MLIFNVVRVGVGRVPRIHGVDRRLLIFRGSIRYDPPAEDMMKELERAMP